MSSSRQAKLADLGLSITIPDGWQRITHSIWSEHHPAMHYQANGTDEAHAECELVCSRQGNVQVSPRGAAEAIERELAEAYAKFEYTDTRLGGEPATRLDCTEAFGAPEYMRHYCLEHNHHLVRLRFITTNRAVSEPEFDATVASIRLGDPATECVFGELALVDYAPAALECVLAGSVIAHQRGEKLSGRHLIGSLVHGDSGIAASILQSLGATAERLGWAPPSDDDDSDFDIHRLPVPTAVFSLLTGVVPRYARDTIRSHHVLLGILSKDNVAGGPDLLAELGIGLAEARAALADEIGQERDTRCAFCSFCRKPRFDVKLLVPSAFSHICDECIASCKALLDDRQPSHGVMRRYTGAEKSHVFTGCGYCGDKSNLFTAASESYFICGTCVERTSAIAERQKENTHAR